MQSKVAGLLECLHPQGVAMVMESCHLYMVTNHHILVPKRLRSHVPPSEYLTGSPKGASESENIERETACHVVSGSDRLLFRKATLLYLQAMSNPLQKTKALLTGNP